MTKIIQHAVILNSQNRLRNADSRAREWAIAHAGSYQSQARKELGGSGAYREWKSDNLTIRIAKLTTTSYKKVQLCSINYQLSGGSEPYVAYVVTYTPSETEQSGGYCITAAVVPDALTETVLPWGNNAGPAALEKLVESINSERSRPLISGDGAKNIGGIDDLFAIYNTAVVLTEEASGDFDVEEVAEQHGDWATVVGISASEQVALARELPDDQLHGWIRAKIALFARYAGPDGKRLLMAETDPEPAMAFVNEERDRVANEVSGRNAVALLNVLESVSATLSHAEFPVMDDAADASDESTMHPERGPEAAATPNDVIGQQRISTLQDQLEEAEATIAELRQRLTQYEEYATEDQDAEADNATPETAADINRHVAVLDAITNPDRFPRLRFLSNCEKLLADYGKPRPTGVEIVAALDAINRLAQAWHNTPSRHIGTWDNYFIDLAGWKHADGESPVTMARYGAKRSFSDQEKGRHVTIERHLTYQGSSGGLQIYFDLDDVTDKFMVGYIGEHLPYHTSPS